LPLGMLLLPRAHDTNHRKTKLDHAFIHLNKEYTMKKNVGGIDRLLRIIAGLILVALAATGQIGAWGWLGLIVLATGILSFCGAYTVLGINTCALKHDDQAST
jgi:hypothetical protein